MNGPESRSPAPAAAGHRRIPDAGGRQDRPALEEGDFLRRKIFSAGLIGMAAVVFSATPAAAGTNVIPTYSPDNGAGGKFTASGDKFTVCDLKSDGLRARMTAWSLNYIGGVGSTAVNRGIVDDTTANGSCVTKSINIPEDHYVWFQICTYRSSSKQKISCRTSSKGRA
ncbi:hypothetical protein [Actinomadura algeriensis]|uniref:hypothetical protein n=1 Tax=Actinomadura algeriensis TaxID=1679523 RepID=UPI00178AFB86|nr:hypothetical protein [Actinomadura algeriensis]